MQSSKKRLVDNTDINNSVKIISQQSNYISNLRPINTVITQLTLVPIQSTLNTT